MKTVALVLSKPDTIWNDEIQQKGLEEVIQIILRSDLNQRFEQYTTVISSSLTLEMLQCFPNCKAIFVPKTGMDDFPLDYIKEQGIFIRSSHANAATVAEHGIGLLISLLHMINYSDSALRQGEWNRFDKRVFITTLANSKVGILGYGAIGKACERMLQGFGCEIYAYTRRASDNPKYINDLDQFLDVCDIVINCLPLSKETENLINESNIDLLNGKYIVNISRGEIFEEKPLYDGLSQGKIAGLASDVWYVSPTMKDELVMPAHYPFEKLNNVIMTPHNASKTKDGRRNYVSDTLKALKNYLEEVDYE